jgi:hypothetical protein
VTTLQNLSWWVIIFFGFFFSKYLLFTLIDSVYNCDMQPIFGVFEEYLRTCNFRYIMACCDNGTIDTFDIAMTDKPFKTTSIGLGWNEFCTTSEFVVGDVLCFKFSLFDRSNVAFVYKLNV